MSWVSTEYIAVVFRDHGWLWKILQFHSFDISCCLTNWCIKKTRVCFKNWYGSAKDRPSMDFVKMVFTGWRFGDLLITSDPLTYYFFIIQIWVSTFKLKKEKIFLTNDIQSNSLQISPKYIVNFIGNGHVAIQSVAIMAQWPK